APFPGPARQHALKVLELVRDVALEAHEQEAARVRNASPRDAMAALFLRRVDQRTRAFAAWIHDPDVRVERAPRAITVPLVVEVVGRRDRAQRHRRERQRRSIAEPADHAGGRYLAIAVTGMPGCEVDQCREPRGILRKLAEHEVAAVARSIGGTGGVVVE